MEGRESIPQSWSTVRQERWTAFILEKGEGYNLFHELCRKAFKFNDTVRSFSDHNDS